MPELLRMPEVAANTTEAVLSRWPLSENSTFSAKDVIVTIETEKAVVDVEAEGDGILLRTLVAEGAEVSVGKPIALIGKPGEEVADLDAALRELGVQAEGVSGSQPAAAPPPPAAPPEAASAEEPAPRVSTDHDPSAGGGAQRSEPDRVFASPLARRLASEEGLLVQDLVGTGPGGRIVRRDVERAVTERVAPEEAAGAVPLEQAPVPVPDRSAHAEGGSAAGYTDQPVSRMRKAIAARLTESKATAPHFYVRGTAHVDALLALRRQLNDDGGVRISLNDLVVKAVAQAHGLVPTMNVIWTGGAIRAFTGADVSVAVATDNGLVTPVLRSVDRMSVTAVASATQDLTARAKSGRLQQQELEGGSISVSNLGMYGTEEFSAILNPPQSAVLAVGAARAEPVVVDGRLDVGTVMRVTLSVDHRPVDGATAATWMRTFLELLAHPIRILA